MTNAPKDNAWISAYLDGEMSADERADAERTLASDPAAREELERVTRAKALLTAVASAAAPSLSAAASEKLVNALKTAARTPAPRPRPVTPEQKVLIRRILKYQRIARVTRYAIPVAAMALLLLTVAYAWLRSLEPLPTDVAKRDRTAPLTRMMTLDSAQQQPGLHPSPSHTSITTDTSDIRFNEEQADRKLSGAELEMLGDDVASNVPATPLPKSPAAPSEGARRERLSPVEEPTGTDSELKKIQAELRGELKVSGSDKTVKDGAAFTSDESPSAAMKAGGAGPAPAAVPETLADADTPMAFADASPLPRALEKKPEASADTLRLAPADLPSPGATLDVSLTFVSYRCALPEPTLLNIANAAERISASFGSNTPAAIHPPDESRDGFWFDIEVVRSSMDSLPDALRAAGFRHPLLLTGSLAARASATQDLRAVPAADIEKTKPLAENSVRVRIIIEPLQASAPGQ